MTSAPPRPTDLSGPRALAAILAGAPDACFSCEPSDPSHPRRIREHAKACRAQLYSQFVAHPLRLTATQATARWALGGRHSAARRDCHSLWRG